MSIEQQANVTCPVCGRASAFTIWQSINTTENPEIISISYDIHFL